MGYTGSASAAQPCLNLAVGLDTSSSMASEWVDVQAAYQEFIGDLKPCDRVFVFSFDTAPLALTPRPITIQGEADKAALKRLISPLLPVGRSTRFAPIFPFVEQFQGQTRATLLLFTDGIGDLAISGRATRTLPLDALDRSALYVFGPIAVESSSGVPSAASQGWRQDTDRLLRALRAASARQNTSISTTEPAQAQSTEKTPRSTESTARSSNPPQAAARSERTGSAEPPHGQVSSKASAKRGTAQQTPSSTALPSAAGSEPHSGFGEDHGQPTVDRSSVPQQPDKRVVVGWPQRVWIWSVSHWSWLALAGGGGLGLIVLLLMLRWSVSPIPEELAELERSTRGGELYVEVQGTHGPVSRHRLFEGFWQEIGGREMRIPGLKPDRPIVSVKLKGRRLLVKVQAKGVRVGPQEPQVGQIVKTGFHSRIQYGNFRVRFTTGGG